jgi:acyl dehydratase
MSVSDLTMNSVANLGWDEIRLPNPVFEGDTIYEESEVLSKRESKSRPYAGIVTALTKGLNQKNETVIQFKRTFMVYKQGHVPQDQKT